MTELGTTKGRFHLLISVDVAALSAIELFSADCPCLPCPSAVRESRVTRTDAGHSELSQTNDQYPKVICQRGSNVVTGPVPPQFPPSNHPHKSNNSIVLDVA
jgi:hypothetical protein